MLDIYVDGDGCPVKDEVYKVAGRYQLVVRVVANAPMRVPAGVEMIVVKGDHNAADDWIAEHAGTGDIVITADIPLADRALAKGADVLRPTGRPFTERSIGGALATRELMNDLRNVGTITGGPAPFKPADRSRFLSALDATIQKRRRLFGRP
jgi:uncharacterized protein YaiI (UPF0178 family)